MGEARAPNRSQVPDRRTTIESSTFRIGRANHIGFNVASLEDALAFWVGVLGFPAEPTELLGGALLANVCGVPEAEARVAFVHAPSLDIALLEYIRPAEGARFTPLPCDVGFVHLCFEVTDIDAAIGASEQVGWRGVSAPQTVPAGVLEGTRAAYVRSPEGITVEFWQRPE